MRCEKIETTRCIYNHLKGVVCSEMTMPRCEITVREKHDYNGTTTIGIGNSNTMFIVDKAELLKILLANNVSTNGTLYRN